jgi:hypothetical protein
MDANLLEYKKEYRCAGMSETERACFIGEEKGKYWFVSVTGKKSVICSGKYRMSKGQVEKLIREI